MVTVRPHILVVGLGNLPLPYTRHSVGQVIVDSLAARFGTRLSPNRSLDGALAETEVNVDDSVIQLSLFKSNALMNVCGGSIAAALRKTAKLPASMIVIHDSLDHMSATVYPKLGGSPNGHRGIRSVIAALGHDQGFHRLRIGIGRRGDAKAYVLGPLDSYEKQFWGENGPGIDLVWEAIARIARQKMKG